MTAHACPLAAVARPAMADSGYRLARPWGGSLSLVLERYAKRLRAGSLGSLLRPSGTEAKGVRGRKAQRFQWLRSLGSLGTIVATLFPMRFCAEISFPFSLYVICEIYPP